MSQMQERKLLRKKNFNYSSKGFYFVTICTKDRVHWFGEIKNSEMQLNNIGLICQKFWNEFPDHFPHVHIDEFVIMPNHIHGILEIYNPVRNNPVGYADLRTLRNIDPTKMTIPKIVHGFKSSVTRLIRHKYGKYEFKWQKSYHDRIIRNETEYFNIKNYIQNNPHNWQKDKLK